MPLIQILEYEEGKVAIINFSPLTISTTQRSLEETMRRALSDQRRCDIKPEFIHLPESSRQAQLEENRTDGSIALLFRTAKTAFEKGWRRIAVVDTQTYRQLEGYLREEKSAPSLIVLQISANGSNGNNSKAAQAEVRAKRFDILEAVRILVSATDVRITPYQERSIQRMEERVFDQYGMFLFDPEASLLQNYYEAGDPRHDYMKVTWEALSMTPFLPREITSIISAMVNEEVPLDNLTTAPEQLMLQRNVLDVHALTPLDDVDAIKTAMNQKIKQYDQSMSVFVYP